MFVIYKHGVVLLSSRPIIVKASTIRTSSNVVFEAYLWDFPSIRLVTYFADVAFDEDFSLALAHNKKLFDDAMSVLDPETLPINNSNTIAHTGPPFVLTDDADVSALWTP
jgi:hypothetical protein